MAAQARVLALGNAFFTVAGLHVGGGVLMAAVAGVLLGVDAGVARIAAVASGYAQHRMQERFAIALRQLWGPARSLWQAMQFWSFKSWWNDSFTGLAWTITAPFVDRRPMSGGW